MGEVTFRRVMGHAILVLLVAASLAARPGPPSAAAAQAVGGPQLTASQPLPSFSHIFVVVLENKELGDVYRQPGAPYVNALADRFGVATAYYGVTHPSLPNYLALLGGDTFGVSTDCTACFQASPTLVDQLEARGLSWKAYFESMPGPCYVGSSPDGLYAQKHNPFIYFDAIRLDPERCGRLVPLDALWADLAAGSLPNFVWIGPNMRSSTHDASVQEGDAWLARVLPGLLGSPAFLDAGLLVVTYDEGRSSRGCCGAARGGGRVLTVVASPLGRPGYSSTTELNHYSLLRTVEDAWGLGYLGHAADPSISNLAEFFGPAP